DDHRPHPLVSGVLLELDKGPLSFQTRRRIKNEGVNYKRGLGLDVLFVVATGDEVLVAPHYRPAQDTELPVHRQRARDRQGQPYYIHELTMPGDRIERILAVESAREARRGRHRIVLVGGREVKDRIFDSIRQPGRVDARILDSERRVLVPASAEGSNIWDERSAVRFTESLRGPDGEATAVIEVVISTAERERVLGRVTLAALVLAGGAVLVTTLFGFLVARRMTANLDRLVAGARAAARGDLDHRVGIRSKDEIGAVAESFNLMMEDLKTAKERLVIAERVAAWQEIARRLAHEIKNPLTPIQMAVETMRKTWRKKHPSFEEIFDESTGTVLEETARLKRTVSEFSEFARLPKPSLTACDLSEAVAGCLALYRGSIPITRELADDLPAISADRDQLSQILLNLLENARDAVESRPDDSPDRGRIVVETRMNQRGDRIELVVEDNGPGLPDEVKEKLFTPYFTTKAGGTGLGLAIVHRMISDHGGRIIAGESSSGGARFVVQFPLGEALSDTAFSFDAMSSR
ncbi:MAG: ATP-binding protein, partial [Proteobacteria bacterium]|nr:ATP-binding protein [Pseudomonadota bacterium]